MPIVIPDRMDEASARFEVPLRSFDRLVEDERLGRVDLVKIDIEGHEAEFFQGAMESIGRFRPIILSEFNRGYYGRKDATECQHLQERLSAMGYRFFGRTRSRLFSRWLEVSQLLDPRVRENLFL